MTGNDLAEVNIETMAESKVGALLHKGSNLFPIDIALDLVRKQNHDNVSNFDGF